MKTRLLKNIAVISVRCNSKRLPNKSLKNYNGISILDRIIMNVKKSRHVNKIIVATSKKSSILKFTTIVKRNISLVLEETN